VVPCKGVESFVNIVVGGDLNGVETLELVLFEIFDRRGQQFEVVEMTQYWNLVFAYRSDLYLFNHSYIKIELVRVKILSHFEEAHWF
jgi:hypothetical protein